MNVETGTSQGYEKPEVIDTFEALDVVGDTDGTGVNIGLGSGKPTGAPGLPNAS